MKIKDIVRETSAPRYFHTSHHQFAVGQIIDATQNNDRRSASTFLEREGYLEMHRPRRCLSRRYSFFMTTDKPDYMWGQFAYEVEPLDPVERNDIQWFEALVVIDDESDIEDEEELQQVQRRALEAATGYWSGRPAPGRRPWWEHRTARVRIIQALGPKLA